MLTEGGGEFSEGQVSGALENVPPEPGFRTVTSDACGAGIRPGSAGGSDPGPVTGISGLLWGASASPTLLWPPAAPLGLSGTHNLAPCFLQAVDSDLEQAGPLSLRL